MHKPITYRVYEFLKGRVGQENAISAKELADLHGVTERELRNIIAEIRKSTDLEKIIGSCNRGYYLCTEEEFNAANRRLKKQALSILKVVYANEKKAGRNGQGKMRFGKYYKPFVKSYGEEGR